MPPENEVKKALEARTGLLHFTGHGYHEIDQPLESALVLAGEERLTLGDIFQIQLDNCRLVCLFACETGLTSTQNLIDEYVGLASGFLAMGATYFVSTLWTVEEKATALILIQFYQYLKRGNTPALALKQAQQWLRNVTYTKLAQWYQDLAAQFTQSGDHTIQTFLNREAAILQKKSANINSQSQCPYEHPYYWAAFTITGILYSPK